MRQLHNTTTISTASAGLAAVNFLKTEDLVMVPKFLQLVEIIKSDIACGVFAVGEQIPSIHETSQEFDMARQTVERAYKILKEKGILNAVKGKGFFVANRGNVGVKRYLLLMNNFTPDAIKFYNSFSEAVPANTEIDVRLSSDDCGILERNIINNLSRYDYFIFHPERMEIDECTSKALGLIPENKLIVVRGNKKASRGSHILLDSRNEVYRMLGNVHEMFSAISSFTMIFPFDTTDIQLVEGFSDYCLDHKMSFEVIGKNGR